MSPLSRFLFPVVVALSLAGCPAAKLYKEGHALDEEGKEYAAAQKYLGALDVNEKHKKAREALGAVAEAAYQEKLAVATRNEESKNFPGALTEYEALDGYLRRLGAVELGGFATVNVKAKAEEMRDSAATERYQAGEARLAARAWEDAIAEYKAAQGFKAGFKDTAEKIGIAYYALGDDALGAHRYRKAAEHLAAAAESAGPSFKDATARAGAIYVALGKHFIAADRCRQAVHDLRQAGHLLGPGKVDADLAAADECAVTPVAILPFENPTGTNLAGMALGDTIADEIAGKVRAGASEFVKLLERSALDAVLAEQGLSSAGLSSGSTSKLRGVRYLVIGKLTQVSLDAPGLSSQGRSVSAEQPYDCEKTGNDGKSVKTTCERTVTLKYVERSGRIGVRVAGTARLVDVKTGEQVVNLPLTAAFEDKVHYADEFTVAGQAVTPVRKGYRGDVRVDDDLLDLAKAKRALKTDDDLARMVVEKLALESAKAVLGAVDIEKPVTEPASLVVSVQP